MATVKIYSTTWCHWCKELKDYLDSKGVKYEYAEVDTDPKQQEEYQQVSDGAQGVPFTLVTKDNGEKVGILGFNKPQIDAALGL
jgi:glutaredoxin 3